MNYVEFEVNNKTYKLRLSTRNMVLLEKQIGCNPLSIFGEGGTIPTVTVMVTILHCALQQYNHGISLNDSYDIFDEYLAEGHTTIDFVSVILDVYKASGIIPKDNEEKN